MRNTQAKRDNLLMFIQSVVKLRLKVTQLAYRVGTISYTFFGLPGPLCHPHQPVVHLLTRLSLSLWYSLYSFSQWSLCACESFLNIIKYLTRGCGVGCGVWGVNGGRAGWKIGFWGWVETVSEGPLATASGLTSCCHLHPDSPSTFHQAYLSKAALSSSLLLNTSCWGCQLILSQTELFLSPFNANSPFPLHPVSALQMAIPASKLAPPSPPHSSPHAAQGATLLSVPHLRVCAHAASLPLYPCPSFKDQSSSCLFSYVFPWSLLSLPLCFCTMHLGISPNIVEYVFVF